MYVINQGNQIQWNHTPNPWKTRPLRLSVVDQLEVDRSVDQFLKSNIIEVSPTQSLDFLSQMFVVHEKDKIRPILNCRRIDQFIQCNHFKMEGVPALRYLLEQEDLIFKIDLKDAYTVVPIQRDSRPYLSFLHKDIVYQYQTLPFGMSVALRIFSKLMRFVMEPIREMGIRTVYYLDDICVLAKTKQEMQRHVQKIMNHLIKLGFIINFKKSDLEPKKIQDFLGFTFNTRTMMISVQKEKIKKLKNRVNQLLKNSRSKTCRWTASLIGKTTAMIPAIGNALLHVPYLQRDLARSLHNQKQNWEAQCTLSNEAIHGVELVDKNGTKQEWSSNSRRNKATRNKSPYFYNLR